MLDLLSTSVPGRWALVCGSAALLVALFATALLVAALLVATLRFAAPRLVSPASREKAQEQDEHYREERCYRYSCAHGTSPVLVAYLSGQN